MAETYTPTTGMASAAKRALQWHEDGKPGGTAVGLARANQLKDREPLSASTVLRMHSFFSRHEVDKQATGFNSGEEGFPSKGRVAWDLWGGDGGQTWAAQKRDHIMNAREGKSLSKKDLSMDELNKAVLAAFASEFSFYLKTHGFHWNTTGPDFYEYHLLFERIYSDTYESIDPFAENIRTLQVFVPASLSGLMANTLVEDCTDMPPPSKEEMVAELIDDNENLLQLLKNAYNLCELYSKFGFQNFLADRLTAHESYGWLLRSSI
jgi:DNA-binding ferritin-like protein